MLPAYELLIVRIGRFAQSGVHAVLPFAKAHARAFDGDGRVGRDAAGDPGR